MSTAAEFTWEDAARDLALLTSVTHIEAEALVGPLRDTPLTPYMALDVLRTVVDGSNHAAIGRVLAQVARSGIPPKPYMKPGTKVRARRFGREILARVSASGGSTFTVVSLEDNDYAVWQDMKFDDVTIVQDDTQPSDVRSSSTS